MSSTGESSSGLDAWELQALAGLFAFSGIAVALWACFKHLQHWTKPAFQLYVVRILLIVPVYAAGSFLSLVLPKQALYFEVVRDCYEAFVIYCFLTLILAYAGGDSACVTALAIHPGTINHPWPLCCLPAIPLNGRFLRWCKQGTLQFVLIKPVMAAVSLAMMLAGSYESKAYQWVLFVVYNVSYTLALYYLLLFYLAASELLRPYRPVRKFLAVKVVIFATYWQSLLIPAFPGVTADTASRWNSFILCIEFFFFALLHARAFPYEEFVSGIPSRSALANVSEVFTVRDVVLDTQHSFKAAYQDYVLQKPFEEAPSRTFRARTYIAGNSNASGYHLPTAQASAAATATPTTTPRVLPSHSSPSFSPASLTMPSPYSTGGGREESKTRKAPVRYAAAGRGRRLGKVRTGAGGGREGWLGRKASNGDNADSDTDIEMADLPEAAEAAGSPALERPRRTTSGRQQLPSTSPSSSQAPGRRASTASSSQVGRQQERDRQQREEREERQREREKQEREREREETHGEAEAEAEDEVAPLVDIPLLPGDVEQSDY